MTDPAASDDTLTEATTELIIPLPDDWHVHLRDDAMLASVVAYSARRYRFAMVMPNLRPPITSLDQARRYRAEILRHVPHDAPDFRPVLTFFASADLDVDELRAAHAEGLVKAVKFYPAGATTNADQAVGGLSSFHAIYDVLEDTGMRLLVHAESTRADVDVFDREAAFLHDELVPLVEQRPGLAITLEHVSTGAGIEFVDAYPQVAATVTPHHLSRDRGHLLADGLRPDLYCKPIINSPDDRAALVAAVTSGRSDLMLGTDSAPHPTTAKYGPKAAAGVFNAPYGIEVVAEVFYQAGALDRFAGFVSSNGCSIYGVEPPNHRVRLTRVADGEGLTDAPVDHLQTSTGDEVVFFGVEEAARWRHELLP
ncbi:MAG: dihydroorotase [Acidimicrobiales bacterium]